MTKGCQGISLVAFRATSTVGVSSVRLRPGLDPTHAGPFPGHGRDRGLVHAPAPGKGLRGSALKLRHKFMGF